MDRCPILRLHIITIDMSRITVPVPCATLMTETVLRVRRRLAPAASQMILGPHQCRLPRTGHRTSTFRRSPGVARRTAARHSDARPPAPSAALLAPLLEVEPKLLRVARLHAHVPRQIAHDLHSSVQQVLSKCDESIMNRGGAWVSYQAHLLVLRELG